MKKIIALSLALVMALSMCIGASATIVGDANKDGKINSVDALEVLRYAVGSETSISPRLADMNADGKTNSTDALLILQVAVGLKESTTDAKVTNYKETKIDPVIKSKKFTMETSVTEDGVTYPMTIMIDGNNLCVEMSVNGIKARLLLLNGKAYCAFPLLFAYTEVTMDDIPSLDDFGFETKTVYVYTVNEVIGGKTYEKEMYLSEDGKTQYNYYFLNGEWKYLETVTRSGREMQPITGFKAGVNASYFSLSGMMKVDIDI